MHAKYATHITKGRYFDCMIASVTSTFLMFSIDTPLCPLHSSNQNSFFPDYGIPNGKKAPTDAFGAVSVKMRSIGRPNSGWDSTGVKGHVYHHGDDAPYSYDGNMIKNKISMEEETKFLGLQLTASSKPIKQYWYFERLFKAQNKAPLEVILPL